MRVDTHVRPGYTIPPHYDSMIGKLIVHGRTREEAMARMKGALDEFIVSPVKTTIPLHRRIMETRQFRDADFDIHYVERLLREGDEVAGIPAEAV